MNNYIM